MKNKMNKLLAIVLCLVMTLGSIAAVAEGVPTVKDESEEAVALPFAESLSNLEVTQLAEKLNACLAEAGVGLTEAQAMALKEGEDFALSLKELLVSLLPEGKELDEALFAALMSEIEEAAFKADLLTILAPAEPDTPAEPSLYDRLMETVSSSEFKDIMDSASDEARRVIAENQEHSSPL